jgi:hypothetical protein
MGTPYKSATNGKRNTPNKVATETKERALGDIDAVDGGQPKMRLQSRAPTTPCKSRLNCVARFSLARAFHKNGNKFNPETFGGREQEEYCLLKGFNKLKVVVGQTFDGLARGQNQQATINETSGVTIDQVLSPADFVLWILTMHSTADFRFILRKAGS